MSIPHVVEVRVTGERTVWLRFDDGAEGTVDLSRDTYPGVFAPLNDPAEFAKVFVDRESGTIAWPWGLDLDPWVLWSNATGRPIVFSDGTTPADYEDQVSN